MTRARDVANVFTHSSILASDAEMSAMLLNYKQEISVSVNSNITALSGRRYTVDTSAARTITLPASPSVGDEIQIIDAFGTAATYNITVSPNGNNLNGVVQDLKIDVNFAGVVLIYIGSTYGWRVS